MNSDAHSELDELGYTLLPGLIEANLLQQLRQRVDELFEREGDDAGSEFKQEPGSRRLANLLNKGELFQQVVAHSQILPLVGHVLGPQFKLSSLNARSADSYNETSQPLHADMGAIADSQGFWVCNTVWLLNDFTATNGALRVVPGSHRWQRLPDETQSDSKLEQQLLLGSAGSVIVMNAHLWHGGSENRTDQPRAALHAFYCRRDKPQQQHQKRLLDDTVQQHLSSELRWLLALDDPENDRLCEHASGQSGFLK